MSVEALTSLERELIKKVEEGDWLAAPGEHRDDLATMRSWGSEREIRASVIRDILTGHYGVEPDPRGVRIYGALISGRLDLDGVTSKVGLTLHTCYLSRGMQAKSAQLDRITLDHCALKGDRASALDAAGLTVRSNLELTNGFVAESTGGDAATVDLQFASIGGNLDMGGGARLRNTLGSALVAEGLSARSALLDGITAEGTGDLGTVRLARASIRGQLEMSCASLRNNDGPALNADGLTVTGPAYWKELFAYGTGGDGAARLLRASVGAELSMEDAMLLSPDGPALVADGLTVTGSAVFHGVTVCGKSEFGALRLQSASIGDQLDLGQATLRNPDGPALNGTSLTVKVAAFLDKIDVKGYEGQDDLGNSDSDKGGKGKDERAKDDGAKDGRDKSVVLLQNASCGHLVCDSDTLTKARTYRWNVVGLRPREYPTGLSDNLQDWLGFLRHGTTKYAAEPYQDLAAAARAQGHDKDFRTVVTRQRDHQLADGHTRLMTRAWGKFTKLTLGYGYQSWRMLILLAIAIATAVAIAIASGDTALAHTKNAPAPGPCSSTERALVGVDAALPLIRTGVAATCAPASNLPRGNTALLAITGFQAVGWVAATLFVAGFTGAVRKT
ncbi:oxidoreductase [Intrasporangium mesophilum]